MKKRVLSLLLATVLTLALLPTAAMAADKDFTIEDGVLVEYTGPGGDVTIPSGVTSIGEYAFSRCETLTSVTIPDSVTSIEWDAFSWCGSLTSVTIGNGVTSIALGEYGAFVGSGLTEIHVDPGNRTYASVDGVLFSKDKKTLLYCPQQSKGAYIIPDSVTSIGENAFSGSGLTSVTIPDSVISIGYGAFSGTSLISVTIPNSVTSIGWMAFYGCKALTSVTIPNSVTNIGGYAFSECKALTSVIIPDSVTSIGEDAFSGSGLTSVTIPNSVTSIGYYTFNGCEALSDVYYGGSEAQWAEIKIDNGNDALKNVVIHYNSAAMPTVPVEPAIPATGTAHSSTQTVKVDGRDVTFYAYKLVDENGGETNYMKLRDVAAILSGTKGQFEVGWDGSINLETGKPYTPVGGELVEVFTGSQPYAVGSSPVNINGAPADLGAITLTDADGGDHNYFKLRDLGKALGFNVGYDPASDSVFIETDKLYTDAD